MIYARGGRKFVVWGLVAIEQVPIVQTVNKYVNVLDEFFTHTYNDTTAQYGLKVSVRPLHYYQLPCASYIRVYLTWVQSRKAKIVTPRASFCFLVHCENFQCVPARPADAVSLSLTVARGC